MQCPATTATIYSAVPGTCLCPATKAIMQLRIMSSNDGGGTARTVHVRRTSGWCKCFHVWQNHGGDGTRLVMPGLAKATMLYFDLVLYTGIVLFIVLYIIVYIVQGSLSGWGWFYLIPRRRRKQKRGNIGVPIIYLSYFLCYCCMRRMPGMRSDVFFIGALDVKMLSWSDLLLYTTHAHIYTPRLLAQTQELETRLVLYCC